MNYAKMKNEMLIKTMEERELEAPYKDGKLNRVEAIRMLQLSESEEQAASSRKTDKVTFVLEGDGGEAGQQAVYVGISSADADIPSYNALIPRNQEVTVPAYVFDYLNGLYTIDYIPFEDAAGNLRSRKREVKRFKLTELDRTTEGE